MKWMLNMKLLVSLMLCASAYLSLGTQTVFAASAQNQQALPVSATIQSVQARGDGEGTELVVIVSAPATYTSYKTAAPHRLVIDFSQVVPAESLGDLKINKGPVKGVALKRFDTDAGVLTRMEIFLNQNIDPVITPSAEKLGELRINFPGYISPVGTQIEKTEIKAVEQSQPVERQKQAAIQQPAVEKPEQKNTSIEQIAPVADLPAITGIVTNASGIDIQATTEIRDFKTFRLNKPERVVIDIPNVRLGMVEKLIQLNVSGVSSARIGSYPDKVRVVLNAINGSLPDASIKTTATGLHIAFTVSEVAKPVVMHVAEVTSVPVRSPEVKVAPVSTQDPVIKPVSKVSMYQGPAQVEAIDFQVVDATSRIMVKASGMPVVEEPVKSPGSISFRIKNAQLPRSLQRSFEAREFVSPVLRITPVLVKTKTGHDVLVRVAMKTDASFELRREADIIYLDIKHPQSMQTSVEQPKKVESIKDSVSISKTAAKAAAPADQIYKVVELVDTASVKQRYTGRKVTLEFADAEVRKIFLLLSEVSNKNFVLGDEVTGNISLKLVNVPWDQALDILLDTKGLDKREEGNIVLIRGKGKFKSLMDEELETRKATLKGEPLETAMFDVNYADLGTIVSQFTALKTDRGMITQDQRTNKVIVRDVKTAIQDMRSILKSLDIPEKQVMIEARIVEASTTFTQSLGVNWGIHYRDGSASIAGINAFDTSFGGLATNVAPTNGVSGNSGASAGISFGTLSSNIKLDMRLNAAVSAGLVRIVSTPRVATLNHKSAKITQGQQIPYTASTSDKVETKFIEAALALEVTPHINPNGTIIMKIDAKNDSPGTTGNPPPINKKQATTEMMLRDGETTVIGGIFVEAESSGDDGVPFLHEIPFLGNLFKSTDTKRNRNELLIFITPRIITGS